jgi:hypothetical protein
VLRWLATYNHDMPLASKDQEVRDKVMQWRENNVKKPGRPGRPAPPKAPRKQLYPMASPESPGDEISMESGSISVDDGSYSHSSSSSGGSSGDGDDDTSSSEEEAQETVGSPLQSPVTRSVTTRKSHYP